MSKVHNNITEAVHGGYTKSYNRITSVYYWPRMSRDIKKHVGICDICQKTKLRRHAPVRMLQPIPIPSQPFKVVTMDSIPELPECEGYDNILVIVDKLTKYAIFIPTTTAVTERETAELFFQHVISQYGIPKQIISDRDTWWQGDFWKEIYNKMGIKRAYVSPNRDNWVFSLNELLTPPHIPPLVSHQHTYSEDMYR